MTNSFEESSTFSLYPSNKRLPCNVDAEKFVLSAFLLDPSLFSKFMGLICIDDFYVDWHKYIYGAISFVYISSGLIDFVFLQEYLTKKNLFSEALRDYIVGLYEHIFSMGLIDTYVSLLKEKSNLRKIISSANLIISQCYDANIANSGMIVDNAEKLFFDIVSQQSDKFYFDLDSAIKKVFANIANDRSSISGVTGVPSGFRFLDEITCGFQSGDLIILAARPSMGKTALALCLARNASLAGFPVAFVSLEMSSDQLAMRILSFDAQVPLASLRSGMISSEDWLALTSAAARIADYSIFIDDLPSQTILDIKTRARKICLEKGIKILIVDYLQLLHSNKKFESRHHEVSEISRFLKNLAKELSIPVIALSQLSRGVESRTDKRPLLSDLRDSGAIEQDADLILFLYRDFVYNKDTFDPDLCELIIGKHRNGPIGTVNLRYLKEYTFFYE